MICQRNKLAVGLLVIVGLLYFLARVFSGSLILSQSFSVGFFSIHYYGIIMALAVGSAFYLAVKRSPVFGIDPKLAEDLLFWTILGGFIGARLYHVVSSLRYYFQNPADILKVWNGGLSIYGALLGGLVTLLFYHRKKITPPSPSLERSGVLQLLDWLIPSIVLGQIIGRFGNLFNYEAYGYPTNLPWRMFVPAQFRPETYLQNSFFHPWFIYEVLGSILILFLILKLINLKFIGSSASGKARAGTLFFSYLLLYNSLRFCLEFLRIDSTFVGAFRLNAVMSLALILLAAGGLFTLNQRCLKDTN